MNELSLFSGCGGGLLGTKLLGWRPVGYVEFDDYCQRVISQRIKDGLLEEAPIFGDIRAFIDQGYAAGYQGLVDVVSGGFPCQPFSVAGKRKGADDERNMWPATIEVIRLVRPRYAFLENVPGLLNSGYFGTILADLAESGYDARWRILSAAEVGAPHKRDRLWIVAHTKSSRLQGQRVARIRNGSGEENGGTDQLARAGATDECTDVADTSQPGLSITARGKLQGFPGKDEKSKGRELGRGTSEERGYWPAEPNVGRVANGVPSRVHRIKAIGNAQVPAVVATAWRLLTGQI